MRLLLITLEYNVGTFSGNGVFATSLVRSLRAAGAYVRVLHGAPAGEAGGLSDDGAWAVPLPTWGRLDRHSAHEALTAAVASDARLRDWASADAELVLGVDFSSLGAFRALGLSAAFVYLCWRVYSRSDAEHEPLEAAALQASALAVALSQPDAAFLRALAPGRSVTVVHPPLRADVAELAEAAALDSLRVLLACCVRLSAEKEPRRFVELAEALARRGAFERLLLKPALVGRASDDWGAGLVARLRAVGAEVHDSAFLTPAELGSCVFARTALNVHPPLYDAVRGFWLGSAHSDIGPYSLA